MRIKTLQKQLTEKNIDLALFWSDNEKINTNILYLTDYSGIGWLAISKKKAFLIIPEYESYKTQNLKIKYHTAGKKKFLIDIVNEKLRNENINKIGIEENKISVLRFKKLKNKVKGRYCDISEILLKQRMQKENVELDYIKTACKITDKIFTKICNNFTFKTEDEIRDFISKEAKQYKCELAFPSIAASAHGTSTVHYEGHKKIKNGFLMLDFGVKYKKYCSDMTRMLYIGNPKKGELLNYNLVLKTINECESDIRKNRTFGKIYDKSIKILDKNAEFFTHMLGHGLGLDIHEPPAIFTEDKTKIKENIPFTIEPGIYFPNKYGIRIEDTVVIQNNKLNILTKSKKKLVIIK